MKAWQLCKEVEEIEEITVMEAMVAITLMK